MCGLPLIKASRELCRRVRGLAFSDPVAYVYNPLEYARSPYEAYISRYGSGRKRVLFLGMNPGPWGMAQTGVPFGEVSAVRDWMGISAGVDFPEIQHPSRQVLGFDCPRSEVSGRRLWGLMLERYGPAENFFKDQYVSNYCPLMFLEKSGRNRTPNRLKVTEQRVLFEACDRHLHAVIEALKPKWVIGVGRFTEGRIRIVRDRCTYKGFVTGGILHPSPANPQANRNWCRRVTQTLISLGAWEREGED